VTVTYWQDENTKARKSQAILTRLPTSLGHICKPGQYSKIVANIKNNNHNAAETNSKQLFNLNMLG
jgi:hypothetical protein